MNSMDVFEGRHLGRRMPRPYNGRFKGDEKTGRAKAAPLQKQIQSGEIQTG
jgi:hypothetical protein